MRRAPGRLGGTRGSADPDAGFTLIELMVSLTVLAVGLVGVIGVMNSSFRVAGTASARNRGIAIVTEHIEAYRAKRYSDIAAGGGTTNKPETVGGRTYTVTEGVTMVDATSDPTTSAATITGAYKKATVSVSWTDESGFHEAHQYTLIYPGGQGPFNAANTVGQTASSGAPSPPTNLQVSALATPGFDLSWTPPTTSNPTVNTYVIQYSTDPAFATYNEVTSTLPATTPVLRIANLAADTLYSFRVASKAATGVVSTSFSTVLNVRSAQADAGIITCGIGTATVTPSGINKKNNNLGQLLTDPAVKINALGPCSTTALHMTYAPNATSTVTSNLVYASGAWSGTVDGTNQAWDVGDHVINVYDATNTLRAALRLTVCDKQKKTCP